MGVAMRIRKKGCHSSREQLKIVLSQGAFKTSKRTWEYEPRGIPQGEEWDSSELPPPPGML